jgi:hypothetical protein
VNVVASCTANNVEYTIHANLTTEKTNSVFWDTGAYQASVTGAQLVTETYVLVIYDADSSASAAASPGYLAPYDDYDFGMYIPQPYKGLNG